MKKQDFTAHVVTNRKVAPGFYKMIVAVEGLEFEPGQFFQISVPGHILRRPFAPSSFNSQSFSFTYATVGEGTVDMSNLKDGDEVKVIAPLGNGYTLPERGTTAILAGGGCGAPSLLLLSSKLKEIGVNVLCVNGARTKNYLLEKSALEDSADRYISATDDGSEGMQGNALDGLKKMIEGIEKPYQIYACGPHPMLKGLADFAQDNNIPCQVSLEEKMACGFGACMGCAVKIKADNDNGFTYKRVCHEGPVFEAEELVW